MMKKSKNSIISSSESPLRDPEISAQRRKSSSQARKLAGNYKQLSHKTVLPELSREFIHTLHKEYPCEYFGLYLSTQIPDLYQVFNYRFSEGGPEVREYRSMETQLLPYLKTLEDKGFYDCPKLEKALDNKKDWRYPLEGILFLEEIDAYISVPLYGDKQTLGLLIAGNPYHKRSIEITLKTLMPRTEAFSRKLKTLPLENPSQFRTQSDGLAKISEVLIQNNNANEALKDVAGIVKELFKCDVCIFFEYLTQEEKYIINHSQGLPEEASRFLLSLDLKASDFRLAQVMLQSPGPVIVENIPRSNLLPDDIIQLFGLKSGIDIPFKVGDVFLGSLSLIHTRDFHHFSDEQVKLAEEIITLVTVAFENARLFRERESQARISKTLVKISQALTETLETDEVFKRITQLTRKTLEVDYCILLAWEPDSELFVPRYMEGVPSPLELMAQSERFFRNPKDLYRELVKNPSGVSWKKNQDTSPYFPDTWSQLADINDIHIYPLYSKDKLLGALHLGCNTDSRPHTMEWHSLLSGIGQYASIALENSQLHKSTRENTRDLEILLDVAKALASLSDPDLIMQEIYEQIRRIVHCDCFYIGRIDTDPWSLHIQYLIDEGIPYPQRIKNLSHDSFLIKLVQTKKPLLLNREREDTPLNLPDGTSSQGMPLGNIQRKSASLIFIPLFWGDRAIGVLSVQSYKPHVYQQKHLDLISSIASQLTVTLENAINLQNQKKSVARLESIAQLTTTTSASLDMATRMERILSTVKEVFEVDCCIIRELCGDELILSGCLGYPAEKLSKVLPINKGIPRQILESRMPLALCDINNPVQLEEMDSQIPFTLTMKAQSFLGVPIFRDNQIRGILAIYTWNTIRNFSEIEIQHLQIVANFSAVALENARLFDEKLRFTQRMQALAAIGDMALTHPNKEEMSSLLLKKLVELLHADAGTLFLLDDAGQYLEVNAWYGYSSAIHKLKLKQGEGVAGKVFNTHTPLVIENVAQYPEFVAFPGEDSSKVISTIGIPIWCSKGTIGVIHLDSFQERHFTDWEISLLEMLGTRVGMILENQRLYKEAQDRAQSLLLLQEALAQDMNKLNLDELYEAIPKVASGLVGSDYALLRFFRNTDNKMMVNTAWGSDKGINRLKETPVEYSLECYQSPTNDKSSTILVKDLLDDKKMDPALCEELDIQKALIVPINHDHQWKGALSVFRKSPSFTRLDINTLELFARQAALNIQTATLFATSQEAQENYRNLFENSNDSVFVIDQNRVFTYANPAMLQMTGYGMKELKSTHLDSLLDLNKEEFKDLHSSHLLDVLLTQSPCEFSLHRKDGDKIHIEINSRLIHKDEKVYGIQCIVRDITERKRKEKQILRILEFTRTFQLTTPLEQTMEECIEGIEHIVFPKPYSFIWIALMEPESSSLIISHQKIAPWYVMDDYSQQAGLSILQETAQSGKSQLTVGTYHPQKPNILATTVGVPLKTNDKIHGVVLIALTDAAHNHIYDESDLQVVELMCNQLVWVLEKQRLYEDLQYQYIQTIQALAKAVDLKDSDTMDHSNKASILAGKLARLLKLSPQEIEKIETAALLHDIGKIGIPDEILRKKGALTDSEYSLVKLHPILGAELLIALPQMNEVAEMVLHHQEKYDGTGYPDGLKGEAIPLGSRILAIVDAWHAMVSDRYYRKAMSFKEAIIEMEKHSGQYFDPELLSSFLDILREEEGQE